jgi:hypothetical protein
MPIKIYSSKTFDEIAYLSENNWDLPKQVDDLDKWLNKTGKTIKKRKYVADIGFDIRNDACGGGAVLNSKMIKILSEIGMEIYLSEYPNAEICNLKSAI